ncbi:MAG: xylulose kinase [Spirochaetes bacterium]|nr:xylulose kinase [Spirochaetota bacterium]
MKYEKPYVLGIDAGTGGMRVGIFDAKGVPVSFSTKEYATKYPEPGWAEQDPKEWWEALVEATHTTLQKSKINPEEIAAVGVDGTSSTTVLLNNDLQTIGSAILWMDNRSAPQARKIFDTKDPVLNRSQAGVSAEWMIPKILWIKENRPTIYKKTQLFMEQADWINLRLTGEEALSINHITHRWFYNNRKGGWPYDFYSKIGLENVTEKFPKRILKPGEVVGRLSRNAAQALGLKPNIIVAEGGCDAYIGMLGLNVTKPGRAALIAGSSHVLLPITDKDVYIKGIFGPHPDCLIPGLNVLEGGQVSSGSIIKWFKDNFSKKEEMEALERGASHYDVLNEKASMIPIGSEGLIVLDYWQGNRNPYTDYLVQGAIWGLTLKHKPAHIFRAIMEGVAFGTENILRTLSENKLNVESIYISGGTVKSDLWLQIHADVSNIPFYITEFTESTILGSAICAMTGTGTYRNLVEASNNMVRIQRKIEPVIENHEKYEFYFDKYRRTYFALKELMHEMSERRTH